MRALPYAGLLVIVLAGCSTPSSNTYNATNVGRTIETSQAEVISSRPIEISGETNVIGPAAGGIAAGAATRVGVRGPAAGPLSILAGLVGAGAGYAIQKAAGDREGYEYLVKMDDGRTVTLVQNREGDEEALPPGTPVLVQRSDGYTRIIPDPTARKEPTETWVNPDVSASESSEAAEAEAGPEDAAPVAVPSSSTGGVSSPLGTSQPLVVGRNNQQQQQQQQ